MRFGKIYKIIHERVLRINRISAIRIFSFYRLTQNSAAVIKPLRYKDLIFRFTSKSPVSFKAYKTLNLCTLGNRHGIAFLSYKSFTVIDCNLFIKHNIFKIDIFADHGILHYDRVFNNRSLFNDNTS